MKMLFKILFHFLCCFPALFYLFGWLNQALSVNPINTVMTLSGKTAMILLFLSLTCTPLQLFFRTSFFSFFSKWLGLYAFFYACLHGSFYIGIDYQFAWDLMLQNLSTQPFIMLGFSAWLLLAFLAAASFSNLGQWKISFFVRWKRLHLMPYAVALLALFHFSFIKKANWLSLQGDVIEPLLFILWFFVLLMLKIPLIQRKLRV